MKRMISTFLVASSFSLVSVSALASVGAVKVECWGFCNLATLGQICDTVSRDSKPVGVSCDDTADPGEGKRVDCGVGRTCTAFAALTRDDKLSAYCNDGGGNDALVMCQY